MGDLKPSENEDTKEKLENIANIFGEVYQRRKQRRKRQKLLILELLYDYAKNSTLHGLRYIVERGLHLIERFFWLLTFMMSIAMCFYLITNVWIKWKTSPVIVSFSESVVPVGDVPFPSITICPQLKSKASIFNFSHEYNKYVDVAYNETLNEFENTWQKFLKLQDVDMVCGIDLYQVELYLRDFANRSLIDHLYEVAPTVSDVFLNCHWRGNAINCGKSFRRVLTYEGVCYNFNALAASEILRLENLQQEYEYYNSSVKSKDWSITDGYTDYVEGETYPRRGRENNALPDLSVILTESPEERDGLCNSIKSGYTIYVQHPADLPQASLYYYAALPGQVSSLALKFTMLTTADSLKGYSPDVRRCYFPEEKQLRFFQIYTENNCRLECQSNYTFALCRCVWFHMPHNDSRTICTSYKHMICMSKALDRLSVAELKMKNKTMAKARPCKCLQSCHSIYYDAEILKTSFNVQTYLENLSKIYKADMSYLISKNISSIEVYFKEPRFISMRRSELFGLTDFLANCGGLLGLFLGFSFLSLVEIFYFGTLRLFYILRRDLREEKKNKEKEDLKGLTMTYAIMAYAGRYENYLLRSMSVVITLLYLTIYYMTVKHK